MQCSHWMLGEDCAECPLVCASLLTSVPSCLVVLYAGHPYIHLISFEIFLLACYPNVDCDVRNRVCGHDLDIIVRLVNSLNAAKASDWLGAPGCPVWANTKLTGVTRTYSVSINRVYLLFNISIMCRSGCSYVRQLHAFKALLHGWCMHVAIVVTL